MHPKLSPLSLLLLRKFLKTNRNLIKFSNNSNLNEENQANLHFIMKAAAKSCSKFPLLISQVDGWCESARALVLIVGMELTQRQVIGTILWDVSNCSFIKCQFSLCLGQMLIFIAILTEHTGFFLFVCLFVYLFFFW